MQQTKVSVITISYNDYEGLRRTILSVECQDYDNIQYIVIDGGSNDGSKELIEQHSDSINYWCSEPDNGIYNAMNKGVDHIDGEWCLFMNSGDEFYSSNAVSSVVKFSVDNQIGLIYGDVCLNYRPFGKVIRHYRNLQGRSLLSICHQSSFIRSALMKRMRYDESFHVVADVNLFSQILKAGYKFQYVPIVVSTFLAFEGISARPSSKTLAEYHRVYGIRKNSWAYIVSELKLLCKKVFYYSMPHCVNKYLAYRKDRRYYRK